MTELAIQRWSGLDPDERDAALARPTSSLDPALLNRVADIVSDVRARGDEALAELTARFDGTTPSSLRVPDAEIAGALAACPTADRAALEHARSNIHRFHAAQLTDLPWVEVDAGVRCRQVRRPIDAVGLYVPGGSAPLPSALLMLAIPALLARCPRIVICSPPQSDGCVAPVVLAAAAVCGVREVYAVGGAQAIAAMAYGTASIPAVDKIYGPGNAYVTAAKMLAAQDPRGAACDMPAGPSEVLVIADDTADADAVAADLMAQAEHGPDSQALLMTVSVDLATAVRRSIASQLPARSRRHIIAAALSHSRAVVFERMDDVIVASNRYAPEHLIINTRDAEQRLSDIRNAGSVFLGPWAAETFGDYCSGTNHVLPTYGFARAYSGVTLADFSKFITVQHLNQTGFDRLSETAQRLAMLEGLDAHAAAVTVRQRQRDRLRRRA
ncbi:MAG: histidinol dehydrogenase [Pseudomonadota bacterium]